MAECIAVVNAGSSSVKFGIYDTEGDEPLLLRGAVEQIGVSPTRMPPGSYWAPRCRSS